jgi:hypothetical protein
MPTLRLFVTVALLAAPIIAAAEPERPTAFDPATWNGGPRVRPADARSAAIVLEGLRRSETFRAIVKALEQRDVIVYVQIQQVLKGRLAGALTWLCATERFRYVRVGLSPSLISEVAISTLGHELQHALEIASQPSVVDVKSLTAHYKQIGISMGVHVHANGWDTEAARQIGDEVRRDLAATSARATESVRDFDPDRWHIFYRKVREAR